MTGSAPARSPLLATAPPARPPVEVRTSTRRRKYATAFWQGDGIVVVLPARMPRAERDAMVESLVQRVLRHRPNAGASDEALASRAAILADRYLDGVRARSVRWSAQQRRRWGSCTLETRDIRISELLRPTPPWVVDAVLVHELAHLLEHGHGPRFRSLVARYERMGEADQFLAGYALGLDRAEGGPLLGDVPPWGTGADDGRWGDGSGPGDACGPDPCRTGGDRRRGLRPGTGAGLASAGRRRTPGGVPSGDRAAPTLF